MDFWSGMRSVMPGFGEAVTVGVRLILAATLGGVLGIERELQGKPAGLRTHMLVALGAAVFMIATVDAGAAPGDLTRVVQGIATGIGFVGAGAILKEEGVGQVIGLTTAASIWLTAALGVAVGLGRLWIPVLGTILALLILVGVRWAEVRLRPRPPRKGQHV